VAHVFDAQMTHACAARRGDDLLLPGHVALDGGVRIRRPRWRGLVFRVHRDGGRRWRRRFEPLVRDHVALAVISVGDSVGGRADSFVAQLGLQAVRARDVRDEVPTCERAALVVHGRDPPVQQRLAAERNAQPLAVLDGGGILSQPIGEPHEVDAEHIGEHSEHALSGCVYQHLLVFVAVFAPVLVVPDHALRLRLDSAVDQLL
jgi:hypothetical protein